MTMTKDELRGGPTKGRYMKYIVLRNIDARTVFWSTYDPDENKDCTRLNDGTLAYEVVAIVDTPEEAKKMCFG